VKQPENVVKGIKLSMNFVKHSFHFIWPILLLSSCGTLEPLEQKSHGFACKAVFFLSPETLGIFQSEADYFSVGWQGHTENAKIHYYKYCLSTKKATLSRTINWGDRDLPSFDWSGASFMAPWLAVSDSLLNINTFETVWFPLFVNDLLHYGGLYAYFQGFSANGEFVFYDGYFSDGTFVRKAYNTISKRLFSIKDFFPFNRSGFSAFPGGCRAGGFGLKGGGGYWWSSAGGIGSIAYSRVLSYARDDLNEANFS